MQDPRDFIVFDEIDKNGPQTYNRTYPFDAAELKRDEIVGIGPVSIETEVRKGDLPREYLADGSSRFTADLSCSRCAEEYPFASSSEFHLRFRPRPQATPEGEEIEITPDELDIEFYTERVIPLRDLAFEQVQLSVPMKPLCDEKCLGLCPECGANRNRESCACAASIVDDRWGALHKISEELKKKRES
jgi:uncharacterized metal-binding protein YceD (DUF177 family)